MRFQIIGIGVGIAAILYLLHKSATKPVAAIGMNANTPTVMSVPGSFFGSPSPIIAQSMLRTAGAGTFQAAGTGSAMNLPLTPVSPSLLVPLNGDPGVGTGGTSDINPALDYPGIQDYMTYPMASDPNTMAV